MNKTSIPKIIKLREITGIGILDCKKAIIHSNGDLEKAIEFLRETGNNIHHNYSNNKILSEGAVVSYISDDKKCGSIIGIGCETDFLSRSDEFLNFITDLSKHSVNYENKKKFLNSFFDKNSISIKDIIYNKIKVFKEKLQINFFEHIKSTFVSNYTHNNKKIAVLVGFSKFISNKIGKNIAMHIAAMDPITIKKDKFPKKIIEKELEIIRNQVKNKKNDLTDKIVNKIINGKLNKFILNNTLLSQKFIKNNKITIKDYLTTYDNDIYITSFKRISMI